jgi:hypothetical protein
VAPLDGTWRVERRRGVLPPLVGVRKRISGTSGETLVGPLRIRFDVHGTELRYRSPFTAFVDLLELVDDGTARGRATFRGREFALFDLVRIDDR